MHCLFLPLVLLCAVAVVQSNHNSNNDLSSRRNYQPRRPSKYSRGGRGPVQPPVNDRGRDPRFQGQQRRPVDGYPEFRGQPVSSGLRNPTFSAGPRGQPEQEQVQGSSRSRHRVPAHPGEEPAPDLVNAYAQNPFAKLAVALTAAGSSLGMTYFVVGMLLSAVPMPLPIASSLAFFVGTFIKGDFGDLARAMGVLSLVLLRRAKLFSYLGSLTHHFRAAIGMAPRRAYPPSPNPWRYEPVERSDPDFNMYSTVITVILVSAVLGKTVTKPIPLFPGWIGSLAAAAVLGYTATVRDERGDLLRFMGGSLVGALSSMRAVAHEVQLLDKASAVGGRSFAFMTRLDERYHVRDKVTMVVQKANSVLVSGIGRIQSDIEEPPAGRPQEEQGRGGTGREPRRWS